MRIHIIAAFCMSALSSIALAQDGANNKPNTKDLSVPAQKPFKVDNSAVKDPASSFGPIHSSPGTCYDKTLHADKANCPTAKTALGKAVVNGKGKAALTDMSPPTKGMVKEPLEDDCPTDEASEACKDTSSVSGENAKRQAHKAAKATSKKPSAMIVEADACKDDSNDCTVSNNKHPEGAKK